MSVNAGLIIPGTQSSLSYDSSAGVWKGVTIQINYILGQSSGSNPPSVGDIFVDQEPRVWEITATGGSLSGNRFVVDAKCLSESASVQVIPKVNTQRGMICSPNAQGFIDPHWDGTVVELSPFRMAMRYNFNMNPRLGNLGSGGTGGTSGGVGVPKARSIVNTAPSYVQDGSIYIVGTNPSGTWAGQANKIAVYNSGSWSYEYPEEGDLYWLEDLNNYYYYSHLGSWDIFEAGGGSSGVTNFLQLNDTPSSFSGKAGYLLRVNTNSSAVEFVDPSNFSTGGGDTGDGDTGGGDTGGDTGTVVDSGTSGFGTPYTTYETALKIPVRSKLGGVDTPTVATSYEHLLVLGNDGNLYAFGNNMAGQLGKGDNTDSSTIPYTSGSSWNYVKIELSVTFKKIYARYLSSAAIDSNDDLYVWGDNYDKKLGSTTLPFITAPQKISTPSGVKKFEIGEIKSYYLGTDNMLYQSNPNGGFTNVSSNQIKDFVYQHGYVFAVDMNGDLYVKKDLLPGATSTVNSYETLTKQTVGTGHYIKRLFSSGTPESRYTNKSWPDGDAYTYIMGITEYSTPYVINWRDKTAGGYPYANSLVGSGFKQLYDPHSVNYTENIVGVTGSGEFYTHFGSYPANRGMIEGKELSYLASADRITYLIFTDGSIATMSGLSSPVTSTNQLYGTWFFLTP